MGPGLSSGYYLVALICFTSCAYLYLPPPSISQENSQTTTISERQYQRGWERRRIIHQKKHSNKENLSKSRKFIRIQRMLLYINAFMYAPFYTVYRSVVVVLFFLYSFAPLTLSSKVNNKNGWQQNDWLQFIAKRRVAK